MSRPTIPQLVVAALAFGRDLPFDRPVKHLPPTDPGHFRSGRFRSGLGTDADGRGKRNRIAKRRARKGYR